MKKKETMEIPYKVHRGGAEAAVSIVGCGLKSIKKDQATSQLGVTLRCAAILGAETDRLAAPMWHDAVSYEIETGTKIRKRRKSQKKRTKYSKKRTESVRKARKYGGTREFDSSKPKSEH